MIYCKTWCHCASVILLGVLVHRMQLLTGSPLTISLLLKELPDCESSRATVSECQIVPAVIIGDVHPQLLQHIFHLQPSSWLLYQVQVYGLTFHRCLVHHSHLQLCHSRIVLLCKGPCPLDIRMPALLMHRFNLLVPALFQGLRTGPTSHLSMLNHLCGT